MSKVSKPTALHLSMNKNAETHGVFWNTKARNEPKKFGYKTRKMKHQIRQPNDEDEIYAKLEEEKEEEKKKFNKNNIDFIRKNKESRLKAKGQDQQVPPGTTQIKPGTVTLTQDQLAALLASLGKTEVKDGKDNPFKISIDVSKNKIEVERLAGGNGKEPVRNHVTESDDEADVGIGALIGRPGSRKKERNKSDREMSEGARTYQAPSHSPREAPHKDAEDIPETIHWKHMTVGERKRLQWARERVEAAEDFSPWGRPGGGAPPKKQEEVAHIKDTSRRIESPNVDVNTKLKQAALAEEIEKLQKDILEAEKRKKAKEEKIRKELLDKQKEKGEVNGHTSNVKGSQERADEKIDSVKSERQDDGLSKKELERRRWLAELDKQREEQRMKKQMEKELDRTGLHDQWADRFIYHKTFVQISPRYAQASQRPKDPEPGPVVSVETSAPPAAMRSSMVVGTGALNDKRYDRTKAEEKRKWLEDLEKQREEQRLAKQAQKERERQLEDGAWADHYQSDHKKLLPTNETSSNHSYHLKGHEAESKLNDGLWADPYPSDHKKLHQAREVNQTHLGSPRGVELSPQRTSSAPHTTNPDTNTGNDEPKSFLRGQRAYFDPATQKEQEEKRKAQLDYQAQVKAQIEEKERKKKEERERKIREDIEEERKLQMERDKMNMQSEYEQRKVKEREELRQKQMAVLKTAMDEAEERAKEEKNTKRIHHLQQLGHDVSQLKATYGVSPRKYDTTTIPGMDDLQTERLTQKLRLASPPASSRHQEYEHNQSSRPYNNEPYIEDRVLTPSRFRSPSKPQDIPDSPRREFGTQTLELKDLKKILQSLPDDVQIEYKMKVEEALKEKIKKDPKRKVHVKSADDSQRMSKKAEPVAKAPGKEKTLTLGERPLWNQKSRKTAVKKNSEKDPFYAQKRQEAEERRTKRERQLLYLQELNMTRIPSHSRSPGRNQRDASPDDVPQVDERGRKPAPTHKPKGEKPSDPNRDTSPNVLSLLNDRSKSALSNSPPVPSVKHRTNRNVDADPYAYTNNYLSNSQTERYADAAIEPNKDDFLPFMRTTEILDPSKAEEPVAISRENSRMERARKAYYEIHHPANKGRKLDIYQDREREAILKGPQNQLTNPGLVLDHPTARQDMILQQLSSLKKTLMQRQKELEDYMMPDYDQETARG